MSAPAPRASQTLAFGPVRALLVGLGAPSRPGSSVRWEGGREGGREGGAINAVSTLGARESARARGAQRSQFHWRKPHSSLSSSVSHRPNSRARAPAGRPTGRPAGRPPATGSHSARPPPRKRQQAGGCSRRKAAGTPWRRWLEEKSEAVPARGPGPCRPSPPARPPRPAQIITPVCCIPYPPRGHTSRRSRRL